MVLFERLVKPAMCGSDRFAVSNLILSPGPPCVPNWGQEYDGVHVVEEGCPSSYIRDNVSAWLLFHDKVAILTTLLTKFSAILVQMSTPH